MSKLGEIKNLYTEKLKDNQFSKTDKTDLLPFYNALSIKDKRTFKQFLNGMQSHLNDSNEEYKNFLEEVKKGLKDIKEDVSENNIEGGFQEIEKNLSTGQKT